MAERLARDLRYGHPGPTIYDSQSRGWIFGRDALRHLRFEPLGSPSVPLAPSNRIVAPTLSSYDLLHSQIQHIAKRYPHAIPGANYARFESKVSEVIAAQTTHLDPNQGDLLDCGFAAFEAKGSNINMVAALPGGQAGHLLRLVPMQTEWQGWDEDTNKRLESVEPNAKESGWWSGVGQPIQQVCFTHLSYDQWTYLAVRTSSTISIFLPLRHKFAVAPKVLSPGYIHFDPSRLDPNHLFTLSAEQLGPSPPSDVSFNPWEQREFALIDQQGHWSVWNFKKAPKDTGIRDVKCVKEGQLPIRTVAQGDSEVTVEDGWARVTWVLNRNTIVICNRNALGIHDLSSGLCAMETSVLDLSENSTWLLNVRRHPDLNDQLFVTTTSRIFWLRVVEADRSMTDSPQTCRLQRLLVWNHFRDAGDISLRTMAFADGNESILLLYSRINTLITAFRFSIDERTSMPISVSDPMRIPLPPGCFPGRSSDEAASLFIKDLSIHPTRYRIFAHSKRLVLPLGAWDEYHKYGVRLYKILILLGDLRILSSIYNIEPNAVEEANVIPIPETLKIRQPTWKRFKSLGWLHHGVEDPVIAEELFRGEDDEVVKPYQPPHWKRKITNYDMDGLRPSTGSHGSIARLDFTRVYRQILEDGRESQPLQTILDRVRRGTMQEEQANEVDTLKLLSEFLSWTPRVDNVARCSTMLEQCCRPQNDFLLDSDNEGDFLLARVLSTDTIDRLIEIPDDKPSLSATVEKIKADWVLPITRKITEQARSKADSTTGTIASEVLLASLYIPAKKLSQQEAERERQEAHDPLSTPGLSQFSLPTRILQSNISQQDSRPLVSPNASSSSTLQASLPTPPSKPSTVFPAADSSALRLSRFVPIAQPPPELPPRLSRLLAHWETGSEPDSYDWQASAARVRATTWQAQREAEGKHRREEEKWQKRQKYLKKAGRKIGSESQEKPGSLRRQIEPRLGASQPMASTGGFEGLGGRRATAASQQNKRPSSTQIPTVGAQSSQFQSQTQTDGQTPGLAVASQVAPGRFGGRGPKKKAKKAQGFR